MYLIFETREEAQDCADNLNEMHERRADEGDEHFDVVELSPPELLVRIFACALISGDGWQLDPELPCLTADEVFQFPDTTLPDPPETQDEDEVEE